MHASPASNIVFEITQESDGDFCNRVMQADTWEELHANVRGTVAAYYFDSPKPLAVALNLIAG
jgi:hypothetical protein